MSDDYRFMPMVSSRLTNGHVYTKLQVHYGNDVEDIVLKTVEQPTCRDLAQALQRTFRVAVGNQLIYYRGQRLHHRHGSSSSQYLAAYGIFSGNKVTLVGRRGLL
jgi:hypothetical protein